MSRLNPEKLSVEFTEGVTRTEPVVGRHYTLTHSDITAELFLTVGLFYDYSKINTMRDEVLGKWVEVREHLLYYAFVYVDGQYGQAMTAIRDFIFRKELPLALEAIRYGDAELFLAYPELDLSPIIIFFQSTDPRFDKIENWGTFSDYTISK